MRGERTQRVGKLAAAAVLLLLRYTAKYVLLQLLRSLETQQYTLLMCCKGHRKSWKTMAMSMKRI